jgi:hypothetical protein
MKTRFPSYFPYLNKKGYLIRRRDLERASLKLLTEYRFITKELGLELAEILADNLDKVDSFNQLVNETRKIFNYRKRMGWYNESPGGYYGELDPRIASKDFKDEGSLLEELDLDKLRKGLTSIEDFGTISVRELRKHIKEVLSDEH